MKYSMILWAILMISTADACAAASSDGVRQVLSARGSYDQREIELTGILEVDHGLVNLFSPDGRDCIGLLTYVEDLQRYVALHGRRVHVRGRLDAEGCGLRGVCVIHLCGPAIMRNVTVSAQSSTHLLRRRNHNDVANFMHRANDMRDRRRTPRRRSATGD